MQNNPERSLFKIPNSAQTPAEYIEATPVDSVKHQSKKSKKEIREEQPNQDILNFGNEIIKIRDMTALELDN